jgi:hypothetical protein
MRAIIRRAVPDSSIPRGGGVGLVRRTYNNPEARANAESGPTKKMKRVVATAKA